jgi:hypothetical protein
MVADKGRLTCFEVSLRRATTDQIDGREYSTSLVNSTTIFLIRVDPRNPWLNPFVLSPIAGVQAGTGSESITISFRCLSE